MDRYEVKRKIGQGSFGNVYLTIHRKTRRTLVLKEIKGHVATQVVLTLKYDILKIAKLYCKCKRCKVKSRLHLSLFFSCYNVRILVYRKSFQQMYYCDQLGEKIGENSRKVFTSLWISDSKKRDQKFSRKINDLKQNKRSSYQ